MDWILTGSISLTWYFIRLYQSCSMSKCSLLFLISFCFFLSISLYFSLFLFLSIFEKEWRRENERERVYKSSWSIKVWSKWWFRTHLQLSDPIPVINLSLFLFISFFLTFLSSFFLFLFLSLSKKTVLFPSLRSLSFFLIVILILIQVNLES